MEPDRKLIEVQIEEAIRVAWLRKKPEIGAFKNKHEEQVAYLAFGVGFCCGASWFMHLDPSDISGEEWKDATSDDAGDPSED